MVSMRGRDCCHSPKGLLVVALLFGSFFSSRAVDNDFTEEPIMGINYGRVADNIPNPTQAVALMRQLNVGKVRIYDAEPSVLQALSDSGLETTISVTTDHIAQMATDAGYADWWINDNVVAYPRTQVRFIIVGNELFSYPSMNVTWYQVLPAMTNLHESLLSRGLSDTVKVTTCLAVDILASSYPPSTGQFRSDIEMSLMQPILQFISSTHSAFYINAYPYFAWAGNAGQVSIDYALFETGSQEVTVMDGGLKYNSLLDAQIDAVIAAMDKVGYGSTKLAIGETGWPTLGDANQPGANIAYAANYNRRLVRRTLSNPPVGTPRRPGVFTPTYIFALFNEDLKPGATTERNWGLLYPNGSAIYEIDLTGQKQDADYPPLSVPAQAPVTSEPENSTTPGRTTPFVVGSSWCIANPASPAQWQSALDWACGSGGADCGPIQASGACYDPDTLQWHLSWAVNDYYQQYKTKGGSCDFQGAAMISTTDPSPGGNSSCVFPSIAS